MQRSITCGSRSEASVEVAVLDAPWPDYLLEETLRCTSIVVDVAEWVLSDDVNDGVDPMTAGALVGAVAGIDAAMSAWLYAYPDYRGQLLQSLGNDSVTQFSLFRQRKMPEGYFVTEPVFDFRPISPDAEFLAASPALVVVSCSAASIAAAGLPATFLTPEDGYSRIGLIPRTGSAVSPCNFPSYAEMLEAFELIMVPGGPHRTECLFLSCRIDRDSLVKNAVRGLEGLGRQAKYIGVVAGEKYESLRQRGHRLRPERFR